MLVPPILLSNKSIVSKKGSLLSIQYVVGHYIAHNGIGSLSPAERRVLAYAN